MHGRETPAQGRPKTLPSQKKAYSDMNTHHAAKGSGGNHLLDRVKG